MKKRKTNKVFISKGTNIRIKDEKIINLKTHTNNISNDGKNLIKTIKNQRVNIKGKLEKEE